MQRYFAKAQNKETFELEKTDLHHIKNVMRNKIGDTIEVVYDNLVYICQIENIEPLTLTIVDTKQEDKEHPVNLTVAVSLVNEQKMDLILQKLTELGVSTIIPIKTSRSIVKIDQNREEKKIQRWTQICKEASEQSKRTSVPKITNIISLKELSNIKSNLKLICSLSGGSKQLNEYLNSEVKEILFAIGPEGGFTEEEENLLIGKDFKPVSLGKRVMRVETATIYVASVINYIYGG